MTQIDSIRTDYALTFLTDTARDSDINPDQISKCHGFVADELSSQRDEIARLSRENKVLRKALELILPLAKGYAHAHKVGSNAEYVAFAERVANAEKETG